MNAKDQLNVLKGLRQRIAELYLHVDRKHWKPSEKAMTKAKYREEIEALDRCITRLLVETAKEPESVE